MIENIIFYSIIYGAAGVGFSVVAYMLAGLIEFTLAFKKGGL